MENTDKNSTTSATTVATAMTTATISKHIRGTQYLVNVHFSEKGKESIEDIILRLLENVIKNAYVEDIVA